MPEHVASIDKDASLLVSAPPPMAGSIDEPSNEPQWYSVIVGRNPGVFFGPNSISENLLRIPNSLAVSHATEDLARDHFRQACLDGRARRVSLVDTRERLAPDNLPELTPLAHPDHPVDTTAGRWYSVTVARAPGVYFGSARITSLTVDIRGQCVNKFTTHEDARVAFLADLNSGRVVRAVYDLSEDVLQPDNVE